MTFDELKSLNSKYSKQFSTPDNPFVSALGESGTRVIRKLTHEEITCLRSIHELDDLLDKLIKDLGDKLREAVKATLSYFVGNIRMAETIVQILLEVIIHAVRHNDFFGNPKSPTLSIPRLQTLAYDLHLEMFRIEEKEDKHLQKQQNDAVVDQYYEKCTKNQSIDIRKEDEIDLAPADKVRVLRRALETYNENGHLITHDLGGVHFSLVEMNVVNWRKGDLKYAQRFFALNREATVDEIMQIYKLSLDVALINPPPKYGGWDDHWHARKASNIKFLLCNIQTLADKLKYPLSISVVRPA